MIPVLVKSVWLRNICFSKLASKNGRVVTIGKHSRLNRQIWYRHLNSEAGNDEIQNFQRGDFYFVGITF